MTTAAFAASRPNQAGFYWYRYDNKSDLSFVVLTEVIQMQPKVTHIGGKFLVRWLNQLIPLEQVPAGRWSGPTKDFSVDQTRSALLQE